MADHTPIEHMVRDQEPALGDLRVTVADEMVRLDFYPGQEQSGDTASAVVLSVSDVEAFLDESFASVPEGTEQVDVDEWLVGLLDGAL